ncbi:MAG: sigma 54-interacting transcriptional regulator [Planctomycetota bacterium]
MSRILLIDADPGERLIVRSRMTDLGHEVVPTETGAKGLVEARAGGFDLILLAADLGSGVDGSEVCRRLKSAPQLQRVPVVLYSNQPACKEACDRAYDAGCEAYIGKPQLHTLDRIVEVLLRSKALSDELSEQNRVLEMESRRLDAQRQRTADLEATANDGGPRTLVSRELAASRPDGVLVVTGGGVVRHADRGACELLGSLLIGRTLGKLAPASGLEAFVRDARTAARTGFRFDVLARKDRSGRALVASVIPVTTSEPENDVAMRVVLLLDAGKRRVAEEMLRAREPGIPRQQLGTLLEAARTLFTPEAIIGSGPLARGLARRLLEVSRETAPVLVLGQAGSGKQLAARVIHYTGFFTGSFLQLRCSALSSENLEHELFGYTQGAFEDALADQPGLLLLAQDGTLFLSEIAELPMPLQERLLKALEKGSLRRRGASRNESVDCRLIASSTRDLEPLVAEGRFLRGLHERLSAVTLRIPALRERMEDLPELCASFLDRFGARHGVRELGEDCQSVMRQYDWPGNLAELEDCIEQACHRAAHGRIEVEHLSRPLRDLHATMPHDDIIPALRPASRAVGAGPGVTSTLGTHVPGHPAVITASHAWDITDADPISLDLYEKKALLRALDTCHGDKLAAARLLNVGKSTLYRKLKKFDIG